MRSTLLFKRAVTGFLAFMLLFHLNAASSFAAESPQKATVTASTANIYEKPSPKAKVLGSWKKGTVISVYASKPGGWSEVHYNNKVAYIAAASITLTRPAKGTQATVKVSSLSVKATPSPKGEELGKLKKGASTVVYASKPGGWSEIHFKNQVGYVASASLKMGKAVSAPKPAPAKKTTPVLMKDITFGMTYQQVKNRETRKITHEHYAPSGMSYLGYYAKKYEVETELVYSFTKNKLDMAWYNFNPGQYYYTTNELWNIYYGLQEEMMTEFGEDFFYSEPEYTSLIDSSSVWMLGNYQVMLYVRNMNGESNISISYHPANYSSASSSEDAKQRVIDHLIKQVEKHEQNRQE
ncbi:SH3 domain-containing protein [Domibacillus indicus]|uniref:SH3 domain-containing protein n=1 Tax=Domibacillus indicus TaxID=1437523 RepID=UPI0006183657|nr:SH3 domain-containing protein [Domibacillus indicus]